MSLSLGGNHIPISPSEVSRLSSPGFYSFSPFKIRRKVRFGTAGPTHIPNRQVRVTYRVKERQGPLQTSTSSGAASCHDESAPKPVQDDDSRLVEDDAFVSARQPQDDIQGTISSPPGIPQRASSPLTPPPQNGKHCSEYIAAHYNEDIADSSDVEEISDREETDADREEAISDREDAHAELEDADTDHEEVELDGENASTGDLDPDVDEEPDDGKVTIRLGKSMLLDINSNPCSKNSPREKNGRQEEYQLTERCVRL
jgi:hypothetical protein